MKVGKTFKVKFRRRREGKTNYLKRLALLKSKKARFVIRRSNTQIIVQCMAFNRAGDQTIATASSGDLIKKGWSFANANLPSAYLTGLLAGIKASATVKEAVLDIGLATPVHGSVFFAALKGIADAGITIPFNATALPSEERMQGKHIQDYAQSLDEAALQKKFSRYLKANADPRKMTEIFTKIKETLLQEVK